MTAQPSRAPSKSLIERFTAVTPDSEKDVFHNAHDLFHVPGDRGIFGGATISHSLSAAQMTVPPSFDVHTLYCSFVSAGQSDRQISYHVKRVRDGKSFINRQVEAFQRGKCIFIANLSFVRDGSEGRQKLEHAVSMPPGVTAPPERSGPGPDALDDRFPPFESIRYPLGSGSPAQKKEYQWMRARGCIQDLPQVHQSALAYMSDTYFVGAIARVHCTKGAPSSQSRTIESKLRAFPGSPSEVEEMKNYLERIEFGRQDRTGQEGEEKNVNFGISLNHTMFFHCPRAYKADEWMFTETEAPWAGNGRGLVTQRIWSKSGELIATCIQEGLIRLHEKKDTKL